MDQEREQGSGSFEWLRERLTNLPPAGAEDERELVWVDAGRTLAVSRDHAGHLEIFLPGPQLRADLKLVADGLSHHVWWFRNGDELEANRLQFTSADHFDGVVSFLCAELLENGAATDLAGAFAKSERAIALALSKVALGNQVLVGLAGELLLIDGLTSQTGVQAAGEVISSWSGSVPSSRDFHLGVTGVEVKTTTGTSSKHHVGGLHQVEVGHSDGGAPETGLLILSLGIKWMAPGDGGATIPSLVDRILARLGPDAADTFLSRLTQYGGDVGTGYRHDTDRFVATYSRPFSTRFERLYDLGDPLVRLPRRADLEMFGELDIDSLSFRIDLPAQVRGDINPLSGWTEILGRLEHAMTES